jgi:hypothetical protein
MNLRGLWRLLNSQPTADGHHICQARAASENSHLWAQFIAKVYSRHPLTSLVNHDGIAVGRRLSSTAIFRKLSPPDRLA